MTDYISRDVAITAAFMADGIGNSEYRNVCDIAERLRKIPAADVVERKHGEWEEVADRDDIYVECECSECNKRFNKVFGGKPLQWKPYNFCPNCGADMRSCL